MDSTFIFCSKYDVKCYFKTKLTNSRHLCTVPWLLTKSFEKSDFCWKVSKMHTFSVSTHQKVQNVHFFNFFPRKNPLGVLKIEVYPMGKWISFLMSACLPDSNTVEILKIWQVFNSLPYLHMGLRDLSFTPLYMWITSNTMISIKSHWYLASGEYQIDFLKFW